MFANTKTQQQRDTSFMGETLKEVASLHQKYELFHRANQLICDTSVWQIIIFISMQWFVYTVCFGLPFATFLN